MNRYSQAYRASRGAPRQAKYRKYDIGARVTLSGNLTDPRSKDRKAALKNVWFEITQLLPAENLGFQYRIKNMTTGLEFVIVEDQIASDRQSGHADQSEKLEAVGQEKQWNAPA